MDGAAEFLSWTSLLTLQGATAAVVVVVNVLGKVVGQKMNGLRGWLALILAIAAGLLGLTQIPDPTAQH